MKARFKLILFAAVVALGAMAQPLLAAEAKWVLVDENDGSSFYFDRNGTTAPRPGVARVKTRVIYTEEGKADALKALHSAKGLENLFESDYVYDIDCAERESRLIGVTHVDQNGGTLKATDLSSFTDWEAIPPESRMALVKDSVCP
jgi:hypothetical protein